jgi:tetratricopeptide (TPR) repeat protein
MALIESILQGARESVWQRLVVSSAGGAIAMLIAFGLQKIWRRWISHSTTCRDAARALRHQAVHYAQLQQRLEAMELFDLSIELNRKDPHAYYLRGNLHAQLGNPQLATSDWKRCLALSPEHRGAQRRILEIGEQSDARRRLLLWGGVAVFLLFALVALATR